MSLNKCLIIGNLGRDPEMRYTPSGTAVTQFSVAVNRNSKDEAGEWKKETEWFRVVLFRENAERAAEWLRKGTKVFIEGRIQTRQYEKDGQTHYMTELIAESKSPMEISIYVWAPAGNAVAALTGWALGFDPLCTASMV